MRYKTGEKAPQTGTYRFDGFTNSNVNCRPTANETTIPLSKGERFPPINSCDEAAYWRLVS